MLEVRGFTFNAFQENTWVISSQGEAMIIDPGCYDRAEQSLLDEHIRTSGLRVKYLINTHGHIDHVLGNAHVSSAYGVPVMIHELDVPVLQAVKAYASNYGFPNYAEAPAEGRLNEGQILTLGDTSCSVMFLPGHAPGHTGLYFEQEQKIFSGDVLFEQSIGRTDLPGGDFDTLIRSIREKLFKLPEETMVYPGHGDTTTIGSEKRNNPFCSINPS